MIPLPNIDRETADPLREALEQIRNKAFYHMVRHADERGDRKVLGEIKEIAIKVLSENP